jgi:hypothetical protein
MTEQDFSERRREWLLLQLDRSGKSEKETAPSKWAARIRAQ